MSEAAVRLKPGSVLITRRGMPVLVRAEHAEGSFARVFRAAYGLDGTPCALKLPKAEIPRAVELLELQGDQLAPISSPRVVRLLDRGDTADGAFLALEWLDGDTLRDEIARRRRLPLRQSLTWLEQVAEGVAAIHAQGFAHGDLRAENIVLAPGRGPVLIDPHALAVGNVPPPSLSSDMLALAAVLHQMLTGQGLAGGVKVTAAAGHSRAAVDLFERLRSGAFTAGELVEEARRVRRQL